MMGMQKDFYIIFKMLIILMILLLVPILPWPTKVLPHEGITNLFIGDFSDYVNVKS